MRVHVLETIPADDSLLIQVQTNVGTFTAMWCGSTPAEAGAEYDVELSIDETLSWGQGISDASPATDPVIETFAGGAVRIQCSLERVDSDGIAILRIGGSTLMVETTGAPAAEGAIVCMTTRQLSLYPFSL